MRHLQKEFEAAFKWRYISEQLENAIFYTNAASFPKTLF